MNKRIVSILFSAIPVLTLAVLLLMCPMRLSAQETGPIEFSRYSDITPLNYMQPGTADSIFSFVTDKLDFLEFDDCNNCESRAHLISGIIQKRFGVSAAKVWLFADSKRSSQREKYRLKPEGRLSNKDDCSKWAWHVAPVIIIRHDARTDTLVIDPSTAEGPVNIKEWAAELIPSGTKGFVIIKDARYLLFPVDEKGNFADTKQEWQDEKLLDEDYSISITNIIAARYGFYEPWVNRSFEIKIREMMKEGIGE